MKKKSILLGMIVFLCGVLLSAAGITAQAKEDEEGAFVIEAQMLPSDEPVYQIQVTVENLGEDWEGIVRLRVDAGYAISGRCVYDTVISLPQGSAKQFAVKLPKDGIDRTDGVVTVTLLDQKSKTIAKKNFPKILQNSADALPMGILSDEYASLTYLDMGGDEIYHWNRSHPVKLVQLRQGDLTGTLDTLAFLVIDSFDTKALTDEERAGIERWVDNGGILLVGTGKNAEKTLGGLDFLGVEYKEADKRIEDLYEWNYYLDASRLFWVELEDAANAFDRNYNNVMLSLLGSWGDGAVSVLPFALTEFGKLGTDAYREEADVTQESVVAMVLENANNIAESRYQSGNQDYETDYNLQRIFPSLGKGSNRLRFGGLKALVVLYVVFVGPVLYLILRALKKRDFYWIAVPAATLIGIFLVYFAGRGFEIASTNVYSVTIKNLAGEGKETTYLRCYDAGHKEWSLQMAEGYTYAGAMMNRYYYDDNEDNYYHRIQKEGERLFIGTNPTVGFEDAYFMAGGRKAAVSGAILWDGNQTITNETQWDFSYFAVIMNDKMMIYKDLPAGERFAFLGEAYEHIDLVSGTGGTPYNMYSGDTPAESYFYGYLRDSLRADEKVDIDSKAALGMGISRAWYEMEPGRALFIGVVEDWDKTVDDDCSEVSYGCLYAVMD